MSSKFNVSFNFDLKDVAPGLYPVIGAELAEKVVVDFLITAARKQMKTDLYEIRNSTVIQDSDVKTIKMAEKLRGMMLGIMAEANMTVTELPADTIIITEMPFERKDRDGEAA